MSNNPIPRSIIYTPATSIKLMQSAWKYDADLYLIDLEDAVHPQLKEQARKNAFEYLNSHDDLSQIAIRLNNMDSMEFIHDMKFISNLKSVPSFIFMTMVHDKREVDLLRGQLSTLNARPFLYVTIETIDAINNLPSIASACEGMILGSADLSATLGVEITWNSMLHVRQKMAHACAKHQIGCIDTGMFAMDQMQQLIEECASVKNLGFHGKGTVHPKQLDAINKAFRPQQKAIEAATLLIHKMEHSENNIAVHNGNMIGPPFVKKAKQFLDAYENWKNHFGDLKQQ